MDTGPFWRRIPVALAAAAIAVVGAWSTASAQDATEVQEGGTLRVAIEADLRESDAFQARISVDKMVMGSTVYDSLFQTDENGNSLPALATEASASDDLKTWTFKLRDGVKFHNGTPFTAEHVKSSIEAYLDPARASNLAGDLANIESVTTNGDLEVSIALKQPDARLPSIFTDNIFIVDLADYNPTAPSGTGPYKWEERVPGDRISFVRFDDHWRGRPPLDRVVFRVIPDPLVAALELQSGGVDVVPNYVSIDALPSLRADEAIDIYETSGTTIYQAFLNFEKDRKGGYVDGQKFREGMAYLWNSEALVPAIIGEFGVLATQVIPPSQLGHDPSITPHPYDPEKGKALLAEAGINEGDEIYLLVWIRPYNCNHATALASQLTELGYKPRVECIQPEAAVAAVQKYDWDLLFARTSGRPTAYQTLNDRWRMSLAPEPPNDFYTLRDQKLEDTITAMAAATDDAEYAKLGAEAAQIIVNEKVAMLPAYWDKVIVASRDNVRGIKVSPTVWYGFLMNQMTTVYLAQ